METNLRFDKFMEKFVQIVNQYNVLNDIVYDYGTGVLLHPAEIHALNVVYRANQPNITEIAGKLGITRSAASQVVQKLAQKRLVEKYQGPDNAKDVLIRLTDGGLEALEGYRRMQGEIFRDLLSDFNAFTPEQLEFAAELFQRIESHFNKVIAERKPPL